MLIFFPFIRQQDQKDCGVACLAMILKSYKTKIPLYKLRNLSGTDLEGTTAFGLKTALEKFKFNCLAIESDYNIWKQENLTFPLIAHIINQNNLTHYVVVYGIKKDQLLIADPAQGKYKLSINEFCKEWTGFLLLPTPQKTYQPYKEKIANLYSFLPVIWKQKKIVFYITLVSVFLVLIGLASSYFFQAILDYFIPNKSTTLLAIISIGLISTYLFRVLFEFLRNYLLLLLKQKVSQVIIFHYFRHLLLLPMKFFSTRKSGDIISRFLDSTKIVDALISVTLSFLLDSSLLILIGIILIFKNSVLFFILLASFPLYVVTIFIFVKQHNKANQEELIAGANLNAQVIECLNGIETIKAFTSEEKVCQQIEDAFSNFMKKSFCTIILDKLQQGIKQCIQLISSTVILGVGSYYVIVGSISIGQLITYNALLIIFTEPLQNIINLQVKLQTGHIANNRLNEILAINTEKEQLKQLEEQIPTEKSFQQGIMVSKLSFSYNNMKESTLKNISFNIPAYSKVFIVGPSGSGKSTLAKLLVQFYTPSKGTIHYGNTDYLTINYKKLRNNVTYLTQKSFFFSGTIWENLVFGLDYKPNLTRIIEVCQAVQLYKFITQQPLQFDTFLEEGGTNLSDGQLQRLAIARALLKNSNILILDEATSALDPLLEKKVLDYLLSVKNKTLIFISHHLPIAKACDQILVIHNGQLVEQGRHKSLRFNQGIYQQLWEIYSNY